jgi:hypothetical protein
MSIWSKRITKKSKKKEVIDKEKEIGQIIELSSHSMKKEIEKVYGVKIGLDVAWYFIEVIDDEEVHVPKKLELEQSQIRNTDLVKHKPIDMMYQ